MNIAEIIKSITNAMSKLTQPICGSTTPAQKTELQQLLVDAFRKIL